MTTPPGDVPEYGKVKPTEGFEKETKPLKPDQQTFESYMEKPSAKPEETTGGPTPMELAQKSDLLTSPTNESLTGQITNSQNTIENIQNQLNTKGLSLKPSHEKLLNTKLQDATSNLKNAASNLGLSPSELPKTPQAAGPLVKFLSYVTYGQNQLAEAKNKLAELSKNKKQINPTQMMLVQVNLSQAQQSLEFSSVLLSKIVDAFKQLINVQI